MGKAGLNFASGVPSNNKQAFGELRDTPENVDPAKPVYFSL
jgi:hypothetical protein